MNLELVAELKAVLLQDKGWLRQCLREARAMELHDVAVAHVHATPTKPVVALPEGYITYATAAEMIGTTRAYITKAVCCGTYEGENGVMPRAAFIDAVMGHSPNATRQRLRAYLDAQESEADTCPLPAPLRHEEAPELPFGEIPEAGACEQPVPPAAAPEEETTRTPWRPWRQGHRAPRFAPRMPMRRLKKRTRRTQRQHNAVAGAHGLRGPPGAAHRPAPAPATLIHPPDGQVCASRGG